MTVATSVIEDLRAIVGAESLVTGERLGAYHLGGKTPQAATMPADEEEVSRVLALAWKADLGVAPWGGGCHQSIGYPPSRYDLVLDLTRLNRLLAHEPADMTATAQAGVRMADLQRQLGEHDQFLPLDVPMPRRTTLGGALAAKLGGPLRCRYGTARDLLLGVRMAHADGTITKGGAKVVKNATGYDVTKLYLGSHGTLGIILEATFRLYPQPEVEQGWWLGTRDLDTAQRLVDRILGSHLVPNRVELLDEAAAQACGISGPGVVVSISGLPETVEGQRVDLDRIVGEFGTTLAEIRDGERTWSRLSDFPWVSPGRDSPGLQALWRGGVTPADCGRAIQVIREATRPPAAVAIASTVSHGALRGRFRAETVEALVENLRAAREILVGLGGYMVLMNLPEAARGWIDVWGTPPAGLGVMKRLKAAFDAKAILNPGRFVGGI
ncbi:MAG: FAD-binding oxidoreductase [Candidatus Methylomirabilales bacterium]